MTMTRWERLEDWLFQTGTRRFTAAEYAAAKGVPTKEATADIQAYLEAQRTRWYWGEKDGRPVKKGGSKTTHVLRRQPGTRTSTTVWLAGVSVKDARSVGNGFSDDVARKALRAFQPDLLRIAENNSKAAKQVEAQITATIGHAIKILELAAQGIVPDDEDEA